MSVNLGELVARARLDTSGITRGVSELQRQLRTLQGSVAGATGGRAARDAAAASARGINQVASSAAGAARDVDGLGRAMGRTRVASSGMTQGLSRARSAVAQLSQAVGLATAAVGGFGIKAAADMQQAQIGFTTLLGSAQEAQAMLKQLQAFALKTPFDFPGVRDAAQRLLAFGFAGEQIIPTLTAIGDAAAGLNIGADGVQRITVALGQISAKGRVQSQELLQLAEAGIKAPQILANAYGISQQQLLKYVEKGLIPASQAIPALLRGIEVGSAGVAGATAKFGGIMDAQSKTLSGQFSNLRDIIRKALQDAFTPAIPQLTKFVVGLSTVLKPAIAGLTQVVLALLPAVEAIGPLLGPMFASIGAIAAQVAPIVAQVVTLVGPQLLAALQSTAPAIVALVQASGQLMLALAPLLPVLARIISALARLLVPVLQAATSAVTVLTHVMGPFTPAIVAAGTAFVGLATAVAVVTRLKAGYTTAMGVFTQATDLTRSAQNRFRASTYLTRDAIVAEGNSATVAAGKLRSLIGLAGVLAALPAISFGVDKLREHQASALDKDTQRMIDLVKAGKVQFSFLAKNGYFDHRPGQKASFDRTEVLRQLISAGTITIADAIGAGLGKYLPEEMRSLGFGSDGRPVRGSSGPDGTARRPKKTSKSPPPPSGPGFKLPPLGGSGGGRAKAGRSPEAVAAQTGLSMAMALRDGLARGQVDVVAAAQALARSAAAGLTPALRADTAELVTLARMRVGVASRLAAAQRALTDALTARADFARSIAGQARAFADITQVDLTLATTTTERITHLAADSNGVIVTLFDRVSGTAGADTLVRFLQDRLASIRAFVKNIADLTKRGLNNTTLRELVDAGPEAAGAAAAALDAGSAATIKQINSLQTQVNAASKSLGGATSHTFYDAGVKAAQGLVAGLKSQDAVLATAMRNLARTLVAELRAALKIKSPSRVTFEVGGLTGAGLVKGLDGQHKAVSLSARRLASTMTGSLQPGALNLAGVAGRAQAMASAGVRGGDRSIAQHVTYNAGPTMTSADLAADLAWLAKGGAG